MSYFAEWKEKEESPDTQIRELRFEMTEGIYTAPSYKVPVLTTSEKRLGKKDKKIRKKNRKRYYEIKKRRK